MLLMGAEVLHLCKVAAFFPDDPSWRFACEQQTHVAWRGWSAHDLIQPAFTFAVGSALAFSLANRRARNQTALASHVHAWSRAVVLVVMGIFLRSLRSDTTQFTFVDTLTQIGLGYGLAFTLACRPVRDQWIALVVILGAYWGAFALYPVPADGFDPTTVGVPADWEYTATGFEAHWNKNTNAASAFDRWFLNLLPREKPFEYQEGGYQTLNFIPTLGTMLMGLLVGGMIRSGTGSIAILVRLILFGAACVGAGYSLDHYGFCPLVKRIWTPSFALFSGGCCAWILAALYLIVDALRLRFLAFPLIVIGMNSIVMYWMNWTMDDFVLRAFRTHVGPDFSTAFGTEYETLVSGGAVLLTYWLIVFWMYRRKILVRI